MQLIFVTLFNRTIHDMKILGTFPEDKPYHGRKAFANPTTYAVGQIRSGQLVTAICRKTNLVYHVYTVPAGQAVKLDMLHKEQAKREAGQQTYLCGKHMWTVTINPTTTEE